MDLNSVALTGRLTRDVESKHLPTGTQLASFSLAVSGGRDKVGFYDCDTFGKSAELAMQYLRKGSRVAVEGRLNYESWTSPEGHKRSKVSVVVNRFVMLDSRKDSQNESDPRDEQPADRDHPF